MGDIPLNKFLTFKERNIMAERQTYPTADGTFAKNPMIEFGEFQKTRKEGMRLYRGIASLTADGVIESVRLLYETWKENKVEATITIIGLGMTVVGVPVFGYHLIAGAIAPAQISDRAPESARLGNMVGRAVNYTGANVLKPVATQIAVDAYTDSNLYGGTVPVGRNIPGTSGTSAAPGFNNVPGVVNVSNPQGANPSTPTGGLTPQQQEAINRALGH
jgi:hypothetical protein